MGTKLQIKWWILCHGWPHMYTEYKKYYKNNFVSILLFSRGV
jgi:hypothetical protein